MSDLIDKQVVLDTIHLFFTEEIDKIPTKKTEDGEVLIMCKAQPLFAINKTLCKRIKALPSVSPTQNCVENALDMRCDNAISRQAAINVIEKWLECSDYNETERHIMRATESILYDLPSVTPQEPKTDTLDKIRADIEKVFCMSVVTNELRTPMEVKTEILQIIDKYKAESEE